MKLILFLITIFILLLLFDYYQHSYYIYDKNFLEKEFIKKVTNVIKRDNNWLYTTNIVNDKIKHNNNIESRKKESIKKLNNGQFSYSKYEYANEVPILKEINEYLNSPKILKKVSSLTGKKIDKTTDIFISKFTPGDFLSTHNDTNLGRYAFIIYLNEKWDKRCGGDLNIITDLGIHVPIEPEYNKLVLIDIKSSVKPHYINTIKCGNRLAITGWFL